MGGAERQMSMLARALARTGLSVCHVVTQIDGLPAEAEGVDLVAEEPLVPGAGARARARRTFVALSRADARIYLQRSAGLATGLVGIFARSRRRGFIFSSSTPLDLNRKFPLERHESAGLRIGLRLANAVVVQTHEQAAAAGGRRLVRIPSLCEPPAPDESPKDAERDMFLWVGRPASYKNPTAFVDLARSVPEARFLMVGIDAGRSRVGHEAHVAAATLANLDVRPPLPPAEVLPLYRRAVAVVNTSDFEGWPNTFMEGWARGALALSLKVDPDEVITRHGIGIVADGSLASLAAAGQRMWTERNSLQDRREAAHRYVVEHHAPEKVARQWADLLSGLVGGQ
jgi:glycosyltransferase involved in cell wall biosynthesis